MKENERLDDGVSEPDEMEVMPDEEALDDVGSKREADPTVTLAPARLTRLGIGPKEVAQHTSIRDVSRTEDPADLVHTLKVGRKAAMHCDERKRL